MLEGGLRVLNYDIHYVRISGNVIMCHSFVAGVLCNPLEGGDRLFEDGIRDILNWVTQPANANEVVLLVLEDFLGSSILGDIDTERAARSQAVTAMNLLGDLLYAPRDEGFDGTTCPALPVGSITKRQMVEMNKRVMIVTIIGSDCCPCDDASQEWSTLVWEAPVSAESSVYMGEAQVPDPGDGFLGQIDRLRFVFEDRLELGLDPFRSKMLSSSRIRSALQNGAGS